MAIRKENPLTYEEFFKLNWNQTLKIEILKLVIHIPNISSFNWQKDFSKRNLNEQ